MPGRNEKPATKADLSLLATKTELREELALLDKKIDRVAAALVNTQADVREIKHEIATNLATKDDINRVLNAIDAFAKKDHESRLKTLEASRL